MTTTGTLLAFETSTPRGSLALVAEDGEVLFFRIFESQRSHNSLLFEPLREALAAGQPFADVIVGTGPGSYTGVRIGISAALGVSLASNARVAGVSSLLALEAAPASGSYHVIGDARRGSYFHAEICDWKVKVEAAIFTKEELIAHLADNTLPVLTCDASPLPIAAEVTSPSAANLARMARSQELDFTANIEPIYLRAPYITTPNAKAKGRPDHSHAFLESSVGTGVSAENPLQRPVGNIELT
ncbi:MAG: tRNA (adenosine(37)-N6)-threonylcarbamoyltransferase complex dimerization subunit type 1 TsaB [Verrucomicrobia bacterium]|nr:tRNA (adenosine(37)-N6)-threonylcarbamoyltransferase complex dimerization subunit type 1 TsaB [Verrucomicrobiota bacterium]